jgi:hypothetical protein
MRSSHSLTHARFARVAQIVAVTTYLLVKWTWSWLQSRKAKKEPPAE